jgi:UDP-2,4-diacetamido-2,4,6-trideoxy-beta-L-altropyranose hydrolase
MNPDNSKWLLIRADANNTIGVGHVMRCLALAEWAREIELSALLVTKHANLFLQHKIESLGGKFELIDESELPPSKTYQHSKWLKGSEQEDAQQTISVLQGQSNSALTLIVVDHYALGAPWERELSKYAPVLAIDDLEDRVHECQWLLDQTYGKDHEAYINLAPNSKRFIGSNFTLLRKEFSEARKLINTPLLPSSELRVLICLGGTDPQNYSTLLFETLNKIDFDYSITITIVTTSSNFNLDFLKQLAKKNSLLTLNIDELNMSLLMRNHHVCLGAAGSTTWERFTIGIPSILCITADNQKLALANLMKDQLVSVIDVTSMAIQEDLETAINNLLNPEKYSQNYINIRKTCDGLGAQRLLNAITGT